MTNGRFTQDEPTMPVNKRRNRYASLGATGTAVALLGFGLSDFLTGQPASAVRTLTVAALFAALAAFYFRSFSSFTRSHLARFALALGLVIIAHNMVMDSHGGYTLFWIYLLPLGAFFLLGRREGLIWFVVITTVFAWLVWVVDARKTPDGAIGEIAMVTFVILGVLSFELESIRSRLSALRLQEKQKLEEALSDLETLHGLVPICASCKSVRDDQGYWHEIENYLLVHSAVELSAAFCPDCRDENEDTAEFDLTVPAFPLAAGKVPPVDLVAREHFRRRRKCFLLGMGVLIPITTYIGSINLRAGSYSEAVMCFSLMLLFLGALGLLWTHRGQARYPPTIVGADASEPMKQAAHFRARRLDTDRIAYGLAAGASGLVMAYQMWTGAYGGFAVLWLYLFPAFTIFLLGRRGLKWSIVLFVVAVAVMLGPMGWEYPIAMSSRFMVTFGLVILLTHNLETSRSGETSGCWRNQHLFVKPSWT